MDNARKKYINVERLSIGDIFALIDSIKSDDEGDIENTMNDSDTDFVAEDDSVISNNIIRKEEVGDQSSSVSVPEASIHILFTQNEDETDRLGQDEPNSAPAIQRTSNQSPSPAPQCTSNQSHSPASQRISNQSPADQEPAAVVTRYISDESSKSTTPPTVTLLKNTKKWKQSLMIKDKTKKKKVNAPSKRTTQTRKEAASRKTRTKQTRKKTILPRNGNGRIKKNL